MTNDAKQQQKLPLKLFVLDFEGSGLNVKPSEYLSPHKPGRDADCILEVGVVVLDGKTLEEEAKFSSLVIPPGVDTAAEWDVWQQTLKEKNPFVFNMHTESGLLLELAQTVLRAPYEYTVPMVEKNLVALCEMLSPKIHDLRDNNYNAPVHPGNSRMMFTGNSIANYDIPLMKLWMPRLHELLSYRIMDVSVLRTFYCDLTEIMPLDHPTGLAIKSGGGGHRALDDALYCANSLRELKKYARTHAYAFENEKQREEFRNDT